MSLTDGRLGRKPKAAKIHVDPRTPKTAAAYSNPKSLKYELNIQTIKVPFSVFRSLPGTSVICLLGSLAAHRSTIS